MGEREPPALLLGAALFPKKKKKEKKEQPSNVSVANTDAFILDRILFKNDDLTT